MTDLLDNGAVVGRLVLGLRMNLGHPIVSIMKGFPLMLVLVSTMTSSPLMLGARIGQCHPAILTSSLYLHFQILFNHPTLVWWRGLVSPNPLFLGAMMYLQILQ